MAEYLYAFTTYILPIFLGIMAIRTTLWHLKSWQLREYRHDRMRAWLRTEDGNKSLKNLWFFAGMLPRPRFTSRAKLMLGLSILFFVISFVIWGYFFPNSPIWLRLLVLERFVWGMVWDSVIMTNIVKYFKEKKIFAAARLLRQQSENLTIIAITGSYGKSSTKEILAHLLTHGFGAEKVIYTPENTNSELGIANFMLKNQEFFERKDQRYAVIEMGAYRVGEIKKMCDFVLPDLGIITAIGQQHIELFGSQENITKGKTELARASELTFYPAFDERLSGYFAAKNAPKGFSVAPLRSSFIVGENFTDFVWQNIPFHLPWGGEFYAYNAHLCLNVAKHLGLNILGLQIALKSLKPMERTLMVKENAKKVLYIEDLYSANPTGVAAAMAHLQRAKGKKIMVMIPMRELGKEAEKHHRAIFIEAKKQTIDLYWLNDDFAELGEEIMGENWKGNDLKAYKKELKKLKEGDGVLLESRLPTPWIKATHNSLILE